MLGKKVAAGAATMGVFQLIAKGLDLALMFLLARILGPEDFGLVAVAVAFLLIANSVTELPVVDVLVQNEELDPSLIDTAFTLTLLRGILVALIILAAAYPLAAFYSDPRLNAILCVLAIVPIMVGLNSPALVHSLRRLDYGPTARSALIGKFCGVVSTIALAANGAGYWALISNLVLTPFGTMLATHFMARYRPRFGLTGARLIIGFASWVTISRMIWTLNMQADRFLIGRILGKASLGQYALGSDIASTATYAIAGPILQPVFSGFSRVQGDVARLRNAYLKSQQALVMVVLPSGVLLACVAHNLVPIVLGPGWEEAVPVIQWLAPVIALQMISVPVQAAAMALAQPRALASRELFGLMLRLPATLLAAWFFGLAAAAAARAITGIIIIINNMAIAQRLVQAPVGQQIINSWRSLCSAIIMTALVLVLNWMLGDNAMPKIVTTALQILVGGFVYIIAHVGLWLWSGRPDGGESFLLGLIPYREA
jgi:lipopolysaccharide exporter